MIKFFKERPYFTVGRKIKFTKERYNRLTRVEEARYFKVWKLN